MEFSDDTIEGWATQYVYPRIPKDSEAWENDVFEGLRIFWAEGWKRELTKVTQEDARSASAKTMAESIQLDVFGVKPNKEYLRRAPDVATAQVIQHIPSLEDVASEERVESMQICAMHVAYKFYKGKVRGELSELLDLCEEIPRALRTTYKPIFQTMTGTIMNALAVLHCDLEVKPNFKTIPETALLYRNLYNYGERIWEIMTDPALQAAASEDEEEWEEDEHENDDGNDDDESLFA